MTLYEERFMATVPAALIRIAEAIEKANELKERELALAKAIAGGNGEAED